MESLPTQPAPLVWSLVNKFKKVGKKRIASGLKMKKKIG